MPIPPLLILGAIATGAALLLSGNDKPEKGVEPPEPDEIPPQPVTDAPKVDESTPPPIDPEVDADQKDDLPNGSEGDKTVPESTGG